MKTEKLVTLQDLINASVKDENEGTIGSDLVQEAVTELAKDRRTKAVSVVKTMIAGHAAVLTAEVKNLRALRDLEAQAQAKVKRVNRAFCFFKDTGNPFPLFLAENPNAAKSDNNARSFCDNIGLTRPKEDDPAWSIPASYEPKQ